MFGSLANTLLDLGLPRIRSWLRDRVGDSADVAAVTTEGGFVHLDGVMLPLGPRGLVSLERATAAVGGAARRAAGLPEARLHAFRGVLRFGVTGEPSFVAHVVFRAAPHPDEAAWIAGELEIERASWTPAPGVAEARAMRGSAKLFVTSTDWRLDDGVLESERARVRFSGRGLLDAAATGGGVAAAALALDEAKVGAFLDAASAILGRTIAVPPGVPIDAGITGELSFSAEGGGRGELSIDAEGLEVRVKGTVAPDGAAVDAQVDARARPAVALRNARVPAKMLPRDEDELTLALHVTGAATQPLVKGTVRSPEIAFRAGRPRFAPPAAVIHDVVAELASEGDQALARMTARAGAGALTVHLDVPVREPRKSRAQLWIKDLDAPWVSALLGAVDARITLPRDATASIELRVSAERAEGEASIVTPRSRIAIAPIAVGVPQRTLDGTHVEGDVAFEDALTLGLAALAVRPTNDGSLLVSLDVTGPTSAPVARGTVGAARLSLVTGAREDVVLDFLDVRGPVSLDKAALDFPGLRGHLADASVGVTAHVPFVAGGQSHARLDVDGGSALLAALVRFSPRVVPVPDGAKVAGAVTVGGEALVVADVNVLTAAATTSLAVHFALSHERRLDGTTIRGHAAVADVPVELPVVVQGSVELDARVSGSIDAPVASGIAALDVLRVGPAAITQVSTLFRVEKEKAIWHKLEATAYGGSIASAGVLRRRDRSVLTKVGVRDVAIEDLPLGTDAPVVMGRLGATLRLEGPLRKPAGSGRAILDDAFYPVLVRTREALGKYGLEPPHARGDAPATADVVVDPNGVTLRGLRASVPGCIATGDVRVARGGALDGAISVTVDDEYLGTSAALVIPSVLAERLTIPVRIGGTATEPKIDADLAACFGRFMTENRVSAFVTDAVEEVSSLFGARTARTRPPPAPEPIERSDADLVAELEAAHADWAELEPRLEEQRLKNRRVRIGG